METLNLKALLQLMRNGGPLENPKCALVVDEYGSGVQEKLGRLNVDVFSFPSLREAVERGASQNVNWNVYIIDNEIWKSLGKDIRMFTSKDDKILSVSVVDYLLNSGSGCTWNQRILNNTNLNGKSVCVFNQDGKMNGPTDILQIIEESGGQLTVENPTYLFVDGKCAPSAELFEIAHNMDPDFIKGVDWLRTLSHSLNPLQDSISTFSMHHEKSTSLPLLVNFPVVFVNGADLAYQKLHSADKTLPIKQQQKPTAKCLIVVGQDKESAVSPQIIQRSRNFNIMTIKYKWLTKSIRDGKVYPVTKYVTKLFQVFPPERCQDLCHYQAFLLPELCHAELEIARKVSELLVIKLSERHGNEVTMYIGKKTGHAVVEGVDVPIVSLEDILGYHRKYTSRC